MKKIILALIGALIIGGIIMVYGLDESKSKHEVIVKKDIVVLTETISYNSNELAWFGGVSYPEGFTYENTVVLSIDYTRNAEDERIYWQTMNGNVTYAMAGLEIGVWITDSVASTTNDIKFRIVLMKLE